ncbi:MAG: hypothetical protein ACLVK1_05265 [Lachnospiraceae bacterium]|jgi:hypothetical protein
MHQKERDSYKGFVIGENGEIAEIEGVLISERQLPATRSAEYNRYERTYMYAVPRGVTGSVTVDETDDALVTTAYLTIEYSSIVDEQGRDLFLLDRVSGYWKEPSDSAVVTRSYVDYACVRIEEMDQMDTNVPVSNHFSIDTGYTIGAPDWAGGTIGANLYLDFKRGTSSTWSLVVKNLLFGAL